jgi:hypothetical protein
MDAQALRSEAQELVNPSMTASDEGGAPLKEADNARVVEGEGEPVGGGVLLCWLLC